MKEPVYSAKCNLFGKTLSYEIQAIFVKRYALKRSRNIGTVNIARKLRQNGTNQSQRGRVVREVTEMVLQTLSLIHIFSDSSKNPQYLLQFPPKRLSAVRHPSAAAYPKRI